jgi:hypothetical protein
MALTIAELQTSNPLAIPASESHTLRPGYHQKSIPLRFLETSLDAAFFERLIGVGDACPSSIKTPPK